MTKAWAGRIAQLILVWNLVENDKKEPARSLQRGRKESMELTCDECGQTRECVTLDYGEFDVSVCQACNAKLMTTVDNVGFEEPDPTHIEIERSCPNGCIQDETVIIL